MHYLKYATKFIQTRCASLKPTNNITAFSRNKYNNILSPYTTEQNEQHEITKTIIYLHAAAADNW
jgi:hypothetical protein